MEMLDMFGQFPGLGVSKPDALTKSRHGRPGYVQWSLDFASAFGPGVAQSWWVDGQRETIGTGGSRRDPPTTLDRDEPGCGMAGHI